MGPQFVESLLVELIAFLAEKGISVANIFYRHAKSAILNKFNYRQFVKGYFKEYPQLADVEKNMRKNMKPIAKCVVKGMLGQNSSEKVTYAELQAILKLPTSVFETGFVISLFRQLKPVVISMLPEEAKRTLGLATDMQIAESSAQTADVVIKIAEAVGRAADATETLKVEFKVFAGLFNVGNTKVSKEDRYVNPALNPVPFQTATGILDVEKNQFYVLLNRLRDRCYDQKHKKLEGRGALLDDIKSWLACTTAERVAFCSLIGPGGAGKTHIGLEIAKDQFAGFQPYYFEKVDFDYLNDVLRNYISDIKFREDTLLIFDYVYEQIDVIRKFISCVERNNNAPYRISIMFIERNSELENSNKLPHSKKFLINAHPVATETPAPIIYSLTMDDLTAILENAVPDNLHHVGFIQQCRKIADQVANQIDPIYKRPIFIIFISEMFIDACSNQKPFQLDVGTCDALIEKYWTWKTNIQQNLALRNLCDEFSKVIITCASALNRNIRITYSTENNAICKVSIPRDTQLIRKHIVPMIEEYLQKFDKEFLSSDSFRNYMEQLCKTKYYSPFDIGNLCIVIKPEKDLVTEWLVHQAYKQYKRYNDNNIWLKNISRALLSYSPNGYIALLNRGMIDFPDLAEIKADVDFIPNDDYGKLLDYCKLLLRDIAYIELDHQIPSEKMVSIVRIVLSMLPVHEDYFNTEEDPKKMLEIYLQSLFFREKIEYMKSCCYSLVSSLPAREEPDDLDERSLRRT